eukprot:6218315-Pyramimonas_sp.AAC.3
MSTRSAVSWPLDGTNAIFGAATAAQSPRKDRFERDPETLGPGGVINSLLGTIRPCEVSRTQLANNIDDGRRLLVI